MLTPISTKIEEFENAVSKKWESYGMSWSNDDTRTFIRTLLQQRDKEWRELVESEKKEIPHGYYAQPVRTPSHNHTWNAALDNIITKSKEI